MNDIRVIKLVSGETIVAKTAFTPSFIQILEPIQFTVVSNEGRGRLVASEWMMSEQTTFKLRKDHIVAMAEPTEMLLEYYQNSVHHLNSDDDEDEDDLISALIRSSTTTSNSQIVFH